MIEFSQRGEVVLDEFNECLKAANYIIKQCGVRDQNSAQAYVKGDLRFERTNTNDTEVAFSGKVVLSAHPPGSSKQVIWEPGDWVQEVREIKERIERLDSEDEQGRVSRAKEYCEGYDYGVFAGRAYSEPKNDAGGPSYRAGFARGLSAANRSKYGESSAEQNAKEAISDSVRRLEDAYLRQGQTFTEDQSKDWNHLQASIKGNGDRSYQDILLVLYRHLKVYEEDVILRGTKEEKAAIELVKKGVVSRLAKTSLDLPMPG
jgi:hypothetical protein